MSLNPISRSNVGSIYLYRATQSKSYVISIYFSIYLSGPIMKKNCWGHSGKESVCELQDMQVQFPAEGDGNPLQYSCLETSMDREAWQAVQSIGSQRLGHDWPGALPGLCI